jgi:flagellar biosynthetic protein FlhB
MSSGQDDAEKNFEPTAQKLKRAREKGEIAKSQDISIAAGYAGLAIGFAWFGVAGIQKSGAALSSFLDQPERFVQRLDTAAEGVAIQGLVQSALIALLPVFVLPFAAVLLSILAQRAFVVTPSKLAFKLNRISLISNAKNKFGRAGLFEFFKSFVKLVLYSICLAWLLSLRLPEILAAAATPYQATILAIGRLTLEFLFLVVAISGILGVIDMIWQQAEHRRKNMMSRKEIQDEMKEAEGDPHMKNQRRQRGQEIASQQMMAEVANADVIVVNPTHYAVALKWDRLPGSAPVCVAKGVDEIAARIRELAAESAVPIHSDPPTARAVYATVEIGMEIDEAHYKAVAAAIRFADRIRQRAKGAVT